MQLLRRVETRGVLTGRRVAAAAAVGNILAVPAIVAALIAARMVLR